MADTKKVTRIKATDDTPKKSKASAQGSSKAVKAPKVAKKPVALVETSKNKNIFARIGGYFKGAWIELRQVRWPNRQATWALTLAVILFSLAFMALVTLLDAFFKWIFELIIA